MTFIRIVDGIQDNDFNELYAMQALGIVFKELANLLILLDPSIAQLIKSNLSVNLKSQLSKPIMPITKGYQKYNTRISNFQIDRNTFVRKSRIFH